MAKNQKNRKDAIGTKTNSIVSNVHKLDIDNPIPYEGSGQFNFYFSGSDKKYLPFLDGKDNFFNVILEAKLLSPTNGSCVVSKTNYCVGGGFLYEKETPIGKEFKKFQNQVNNKRESLYNICKSIFNNHFTTGNNFIEIVRGQIGNTKFVRVINRSFLDCRLSEPGDDDICKSVFFSRSFRKNNHFDVFLKNNAVELPIYYGKETKWLDNKKTETEHCIIHIKNNYPGYDYYGMPENIGSLIWQQLEYKGARFNMDNFENNMVIGGICFVNGSVSESEGKKIAKDVHSAHTGDGKNGRVAFVTGQDVDTSKSAFKPFDTHRDGSYTDLDELAEKKIINSNNWSAVLYGEHNSSGLGNGGAAYVNSIYETKKNTVILPMQKFIKEEFLNVLFEIHDNWVGTKFSDLEIDFKQVAPATFVSDIDVNAVLTVNEGRKALGYNDMEDVEKGEEIITKNMKNVQNKPSK